MDWVPDFAKGKFLQGLVLGLFSGLVLFLILSSYEIRKFSALGFDVAMPDVSKAEIEAVRQEVEKVKAAEGAVRAELVKANEALKQKRQELVLLHGALLEAQANVSPNVNGTAPNSAEKLVEQLRSDLDAAIKERDELAQQVRTLGAAIQEQSDAVAKSKLEEKAKLCGVASSDLTKKFVARAGESLKLLGGELEITLDDVNSSRGASFSSNRREITGRTFFNGYWAHLAVGRCTFVFRILSVDWDQVNGELVAL